MDHHDDSAGGDRAAHDAQCDILVVGGGLHGAGIARDLAGRGWSVILCERDDLGQHGASATDKLVHGGLLDLAAGRLTQVRRALEERECLLRSAPHIAAPMRFVLPHDAVRRSMGLTRLGLWVYDHLAPSDFLPGFESIDLGHHPLGEPIKPEWPQGFVYSDGCVDDARLVLLCAQDARDRGASILPRTSCVDLRPHAQGWQALLAHHDAHTGRLTHRAQVQARLVVNAAGPWADKLQAMLSPGEVPAQAQALQARRLVKSSHIVVPKLFGHDHAYLIPGHEGQCLIALPYEQQFTLIGTAEQVWPGGDAAVPEVSGADVDDLCLAANRHFRRAISPRDVVWQYAGARFVVPERGLWPHRGTGESPLVHQGGESPWITVWGGALTTFRHQAEQAAGLVGDLLSDHRQAWTRHATLPGGRLLDLIDTEQDPATDLAEFQRRLRQRSPWMDLPMVRRWSRQYGAQALQMLGDVHQRSDLGQEVAPGLYEQELHHLIRHEWAVTADDVLWRRTKLGLHHTPEQRAAVADWMLRLQD